MLNPRRNTLLLVTIFFIYSLNLFAQAEVQNPTFPFWKVNGNSGTVDGTNFIGTTDAVPFNIRVGNQRAGRIDSTLANTTYGFMAGRDLGVVSGGNSLFGQYAGANMSLDAYTNSAFGYNALIGLNTGIDNVAIGRDAMAVLNSGNENVAVGGYALFNNTASGNTAIGHAALFANQSETFNTAVGYSALTSNRGSNNTGVGYRSLGSNFAGQHNTAMGADALLGNTSGYSNTAVGYVAGRLNSVGRRNTFLGDSADVTSNNLTNATAIGWNARVSQSNSMVLGSVNGVNGATVTTKVGIGNNAPNTSLDVRGDLALRERSITLAVGTNNNVLTDTTTFFNINIPGNAVITGFSGGVDGKLITIVNNSTFTLQLVPNNALSLINNRILTGAGALTLADTGVATLQYSASLLKWVLISYTNGALINSAGNSWAVLGNSGTVDGTNFIGTTDNAPFNVRINNLRAGRVDNRGNINWGRNAGGFFMGGRNNIAIGDSALLNNINYTNNIAIGRSALADDGGFSNIAIGQFAGKGSTGNFNIFIGQDAGRNNTFQAQNIGIGTGALLNNTIGQYMTAIGDSALFFNTDGVANTAVGARTLVDNTSGSANTALGLAALYKNTTGSYNTALGEEALSFNITGIENTASGAFSLYTNNNGSSNSAMGYEALASNLSGSNNTASGYRALVSSTGSDNTAFGASSGNGVLAGSSNLFLGSFADAQINIISNSVAIGSNAKVSASSTLIFGDTIIRPKVGIGVTSVGKTKVNTFLEIARTGAANENILTRFAGSGIPAIYMQRSLGSLASPGTVTSGQTFGRLAFGGYDGNSWEDAAYIHVAADSVTLDNIVSGRIEFHTRNTAPGAVPVERMEINRNGHVGIGTSAQRTSLHINGGLVLEQAPLVIVTTDDFPLTVGDRSFIRVRGTNGVLAADRTIILSNGLFDGQLLFVYCDFFPVQFLGITSNTAVPGGTLNMTTNDMAQFIWVNGDWQLVTYSNN
jgi:hypothetical protein